MRKAAAALLLLVPLLAGLGLWAGPRFVDWEPWRGRLAEVASERLGRPVQLNGAVEIEFLPHPTIRAGGVAIGGAGEEFSVTARLLRLRFDLGAFLAGRIEPREIALVGPEVTLPWPPGPVLALRPPSWITSLEARVEDGRIRIGDAVLEGVTGSLATGGPAQALEAEGGFVVAGRAGGFAAVLGRPGWDGISTLEISFTLPELSGSARGALIPDTGFEGMIELRGPDLSALLPAPPGAFRAQGRLVAAADLIAADDLTMDLGQSPARGAIALRLLPEPRLDVALLAGRLDLDGWVRALRQGGSAVRPWPVSIDLSAEAATWRGLALRRLRGGVFIEEGRLTLSDVSMLLPGETALDFAGATAGGRLELSARFAGQDLRTTLAALGWPVEGTDPALLRRGEGRMRLVLEEAQTAVPEVEAVLDGVRVSGAGVLRHGARPALGLGLTLDRLDLDAWLPRGMGLEAAMRAAGTLDLNLRLAVEEARMAGLGLSRASLDAALEGGRLTLRRLSGQMAGTDIAASGTLVLGAQPRLQEFSLEARGPNGAAIAALLPGTWPDGTGLARLPLALRLSASGAAEALQWRGGAEIGELRAEGAGTLDARQARGSGSLTLRHPGAPRLLTEGFGSRAGEWLGEGSFSLVATLAGGRGSLSAESFELVAGALRARGALALAAGARRPRLTGRVVAERLPLPFPGWRATEPLGLEALAALDAEVALEAARVEIGDAVAEGAAAQLRLADARLQLEGLRARLSGGSLQGRAVVEAEPGAAPRLALEARLAELVLAEPVFGLPLDIAAGHAEARLDLAATGHSMAALLATLEGEASVTVRDGVLRGFDLGAAAAAAALPDGMAAEAAIRRALAGGATGFERLELAGRLAAGRLSLGTGRLVAEGGAGAVLSGEVDVPRATLDALVALRPAGEEAPAIGLRLTGPAATPRLLPETAAWARWRAERS